MQGVSAQIALQGHQNIEPGSTVRPMTQSLLQRLTLWRLFRQRPGIVAEVIRNGRPLPPNVHSAEFWLGVLSRLRLTQKQEELLDDVQARVLPQLDRVGYEEEKGNYSPTLGCTKRVA